MIVAASKRKTFTVLAADMVGYSRLMERDEDDTHARWMQLRTELLEPAIGAEGGRVVKNTGDGFIAVFDSPARGARCAIALQRQLIDRAIRLPPERRITFRIGLNACAAIVEGDDVFGEGVNVAARLQSYAEPGDIVIAAALMQELPAVVADIPTFDLGDLHLKNISRPVRAFGLRIGSDRNLAAPAAPIASDSNKPSIAVLPFRPLGASAEDGFLVEGIVEEVVHALSGIRDLFVISRTSTLRYGDGVIDPQKISRELDVRYLLQGSVRRSGERLRVGTELIEGMSGRIIQSSRYEGNTSDLFGLQTEIALSATTTIAPHVAEWELRRAMRKHPENLTAYDLVLQALEYLYRLDYESHSRARGLLQQAIAIDPDYAPAHTYTAYWHIFRVGEGWSQRPEADAAEAARVAKAAMDRDGRDALALSIFGHVQGFLLRAFEAANSVLDRAIEIGPNCSLAWSMSSVVRGYLGDVATAVERARQGVRLAPLDGHAFWAEGMLAQAHYLEGDFQSAIEWSRKAAASNPSAMFNLRILAASLAELGKEFEARRVARDILRLNPKFRLDSYAPNCPFTGDVLRNWLGRLRLAGLPG